MSWMWGWLPTFYSTLLLICLYLLRELLQLFQNWQDWSTTRRELSKSDMAHDATWLLRDCNLDVFLHFFATLFLSNNFGSGGQFWRVWPKGSYATEALRAGLLPTPKFSRSLFNNLFPMVPWNKDLFLQNPKRRLIFSVLNESNSVEPEDRCSVRVDTDDECDAQFCTKFGCCHYSMLYTVTTQESLASLFCTRIFSLSDLQTIQDLFCKFRPWLACQCKAAHLWNNVLTCGGNDRRADHIRHVQVFFLREKATQVIFGEFKWILVIAERSCDGFPVSPLKFPFFSASQDLELRTRLGHQTTGRDSARSWKVGVLSCHCIYIITSYLQFWFLQLYSALMNFTLFSR